MLSTLKLQETLQATLSFEEHDHQFPRQSVLFIIQPDKVEDSSTVEPMAREELKGRYQYSTNINLDDLEDDDS